MEESVLTSSITLWIAGSLLAILLLSLLVVYLMSRSEAFTRPVAIGCSGSGCDVYRERRSGFLRAFDFMFKTRAYSCQSCRKKFVRFKPVEEEERRKSHRHETASSTS